MSQRRGASQARAEQQKEARDSFVLPQAGVLYPGESAKGLAKAVSLFVFLGALAAFPFGFIEFGGLPLSGRLFIAAIIGAAAGGVVGLVVGPSVGAREDAKDKAGTPRGTAGRPGKAEVAEATGGSESQVSGESIPRETRRPQ